MGVTATGSPLDARQTALPYAVILAVLVLIGILLLIWLASKIIKNYMQSDAYIEKQKKRLTTLKDVQALAKKINLTRAEAILLFGICKKHKAPNIFYTWQDVDVLDSIFKSEFDRIKNKGGSQSELESFFMLRSHLERIITIKKFISSSHNIPPSEVLGYTDKNGRKFDFKILKNEKENITLDIGREFEKIEGCPKPLTKIMLTYHSPQSLKYVLSTRIVRYQPGPGDSRQMVVQHASTVSMQSRRANKRANVGVECSFSAVTEQQGRRGAVSYSPKPNRYTGKMLNISAGGCKILTDLPIKKGQKIWISVELSGYERIECCGLIVGVSLKEGKHSLHISFLDISGKQKNEIFSYVYKY